MTLATEHWYSKYARYQKLPFGDSTFHLIDGSFLFKHPFIVKVSAVSVTLLIYFLIFFQCKNAKKALTVMMSQHVPIMSALVS